MSLIREFAFYPTLFYNLVRNKINCDCAWYTRIDATVILGALPFKSMIDTLVSEEKVGGVVCLNQHHEIDHDWVAQGPDWEKAGVEFYWLPLPYFFYSATIVDIQKAVQFINQFEGSGKSVYVHCKAGRGRSATVVACYLMQKHGWDPDAAVTFLKQKRYQVVIRYAHQQTLTDFFKDLNREK